MHDHLSGKFENNLRQVSASSGLGREATAMKTLEIQVSKYGRDALDFIARRPIWNNGNGFSCILRDCTFDQFLEVVMSLQARDVYFRVMEL